VIKVTINGISYWVRNAMLILEDNSSMTFSTTFTEKQKNKYSHELREELK